MATKKTAAKKKATSTKKAKVDPFKTFDSVRVLVENMTDDFDKLNNGTKAAAGRLRKSAMEIKKTMGVLRKEIQEFKSTM